MHTQNPHFLFPRLKIIRYARTSLKVDDKRIVGGGYIPRNPAKGFLVCQLGLCILDLADIGVFFRSLMSLCCSCYSLDPSYAADKQPGKTSDNACILTLQVENAGVGFHTSFLEFSVDPASLSDSFGLRLFYRLQTSFKSLAFVHAPQTPRVNLQRNNLLTFHVHI